MKTIIAYGVAGVIALGGVLGLTAEFAQTATISHDAHIAAAKAHTKIVKLNSTVAAKESRYEMCYAEAKAWKDTVTDVADGLSAISAGTYSTADGDKVGADRAKAEGIGCLP